MSQKAVVMKATNTTLILVLSSCFFGCGTGPKEPMEPPVDTVNPETHEPYQPTQPLTTGNPMSDTDSRPQAPGTIASPPAGLPPSQTTPTTTRSEPATDEPSAAIRDDETLDEEHDTIAPAPRRDRPSSQRAQAETEEDEEPVDPRANPAEPR